MKTLKRTLFKQLLSVLLCIALMITLMTPTDLTVYADVDEPGSTVWEEDGELTDDFFEENEDIYDETVPNSTPPEEGEEPFHFEAGPTEAAIVSEDEGGRDLYTKTFLLEDMTKLAVVYPDAVHFEKDGRWTEIDNRLELITDEAAGKKVYQNKENSVGIRLPEELSAQDGPKITFEKDSLSFSLTGVRYGSSEEQVTTVKAQINNQPVTEEELSAMSERE